MTNRQLSFNEWVKEFKPLNNPFTNVAACAGYLFEDVGDSASFVRQQNDLHVWTLTVTDEGRAPKWTINNGHALVNRYGYFVSGKPWRPEHFYLIRY